ncbi:hypothetical protein RRF57_005107 [Xylaria bambusicola]|uniref:Uncharacterized protein n=1 Tax=Xylaria bambusicola TaxID=326684 RepID=A0AAN7Z5E7_9PEZI
MVADIPKASIPRKLLIRQEHIQLLRDGADHELNSAILGNRQYGDGADLVAVAVECESHHLGRAVIGKEALAELEVVGLKHHDIGNGKVHVIAAHGCQTALSIVPDVLAEGEDVVDKLRAH